MTMARGERVEQTMIGRGGRMDNDPVPQYPGKRLPEVGLLVTPLFWREVGHGIKLPWGTHLSSKTLTPGLLVWA